MYPRVDVYLYLGLRLRPDGPEADPVQYSHGLHGSTIDATAMEGDVKGGCFRSADEEGDWAHRSGHRFPLSWNIQTKRGIDCRP